MLSALLLSSKLVQPAIQEKHSIVYVCVRGGGGGGGGERGGEGVRGDRGGGGRGEGEGRRGANLPPSRKIWMRQEAFLF